MTSKRSRVKTRRPPNPGGGHLLWCALTALISLSLHGRAAATATTDDGWILGMEELYRLDQMPRFKRSVKVGSISSYDRTGGNDDGFSGKYSFVRKEPKGLVLADLRGPGIIYRIWTPTPSDDFLEFFFDGEEHPRISVRFRDIFLGNHAPFVAPLVGYGAGGFYCYTPLPYAKSCKIVARAERIQFYQINYATYPAEAPVKTLPSPPTAEYLAHQEKACRLFAASGSDIGAYLLPEDATTHIVKRRVSIPPGGTATLFESDQPGRIAGIRLSPASQLGGKDRDLLLRIRFDGESPAVFCPLGDFFGYAWGQPAMKSLFVGTSGPVSYCYFPMPFDRSVRVEIVSERTGGPSVELGSEVVFGDAPRRADEGRFYAFWRRENPTRVGAPFKFIETAGRGHMVGFVLQSQGFESGKTLFFEGDDETTIDGELTIRGTGSEDFFNGGWYDVPDRWEKRISFPLSGCLGYEKHLGRTGGYRFLIGDAYAYRERLLQTIEHGGTGNSIPTDYCAVSFFYSESPPTVSLSPPALADRRVVDLDEVVFPAWWQIPIHAFCFQNATLGRSREQLGDEEVRFLSLKAEGDDWFGPPFLSVVCDLPAAGGYTVSIEAIKGPAQGIVQLFENEVPAGDPLDLYAEARVKSDRLELGRLRLQQGGNTVMLKLVGKNEKSGGLAMDLINIVCAKTDPES